MQAEVRTLLPSLLVAHQGSGQHLDARSSKAVDLLGAQKDVQYDASDVEVTLQREAAHEFVEERSAEQASAEALLPAAPAAEAFERLGEEGQEQDARRRARHAYGEELLRQAEGDARRRKATPYPDKPQWVNPSLGEQDEELAKEFHPAPAAAEQMSLLIGPSTLELKKTDARTRRAYAQELLQQVESNKQFRQAEILNGHHRQNQAVVTAARGSPPTAVDSEAEHALLSPRPGAFHMGPNTVQLRKADALSRRAYGEELRQQAEEDRRRRQAEELPAKPQWQDPSTGAGAASPASPGAVHAVKHAAGDHTMKLRRADALQRRAYGEELRQQAEADHQRRREHPLPDKIPWISPTPSGADRPNMIAGFRDAAVEHRQVQHQNIHASVEGRPHMAGRIREAAVEQLQVQHSDVNASTSEVAHAQRLAYGEELRQQAAQDRQRRHEKPLPDKPQWCNPSGRANHRPFAAAAAAMGVAYR